MKTERVVCFLQLLALTLETKVKDWPPLFKQSWGWSSFAVEYMRWPMLALLNKVGGKFSLTFGDVKHSLWHFRAVVGYGVECYFLAFAIFVLFFMLQMPDYTSRKSKIVWERRFLTHWVQSSLVHYVVNLVIWYAVCAALTLYGANFFPEEVVTAVTVVGGTVVSVMWMAVVLLSFLIHLNLRQATKHDAEYSFMIAMKTLVKTKVRACLFFLQVAYIPVTVAIIRALIPQFDWNDSHALKNRRSQNHHTWCYFMAFPPETSGGIATPVLECTSLSGISVHAISACLLLLYTWGVPNLFM
ncbi:unnamed protein product [Choristocarpus tenellus]